MLTITFVAMGIQGTSDYIPYRIRLDVVVEKTYWWRAATKRNVSLLLRWTAVQGNEFGFGEDRFVRRFHTREETQVWIDNIIGGEMEPLLLTIPFRTIRRRTTADIKGFPCGL